MLLNFDNSVNYNNIVLIDNLLTKRCNSCLSDSYKHLNFVCLTLRRLTSL